MPVMPGYKYADEAHEKTVQKAGARNGCHTDKMPGARGTTTKYIAHPWSANAGRLIKTEWNEMLCGHDLRDTDPLCEGCNNRGAT